MRIIKKSLLSILVVIAFMLCGYEVQAASTDYNIDKIDESKYPGYKSQIQEMKSKYPNWTFKVLYTGINWTNAISGEYVGHGGIPSNLIQNTYSGEWICPICQDTLYDVSKEWYCASKEAIAYMMDPRNSLTEDYVFQFQDLSSSSGTRSEVAKMAQGTFLNNDECIDAIINAAQKHSISPFHLIARIRQEQGMAGIGSMNGYIYTTETGQKVPVYNLFNINVSGNSSEGLLAGAKFAYEQGWTTKAASIEGGAKFLREKYLDKGQSTLYFQKYNVVDKSNLYNHQYMQNIRAANDEGNIVYNGYKTNEMLDSHFEFTIPLYENMPISNSVRPLNETDKYYGSITSELTGINVNKNASGLEYISGNIVVVEWINGISKVPRTLPKIIIESTDGSISKEMFVKQVSGNTYYFDSYINSLDKTKTYIIKAELTGKMNISTKKSMRVKLPNKTFSNSTCFISNNIFYLGSYEGKLTHQLYDISLNKTDAGRNYISGTIMAIEWIDGKSTVPKELPKMTLTSTDGVVNSELFVKYNGNNDYYFDLFVDGLNASKEYQLNIELVEDNNTSKEKKNVVKLTNKKLGELDDKQMIIKNNKICFQYVGNIKTNLQEIKFNKASDTKYSINGIIKITEVVNNKEKTILTTPILTIESTDGSFKQQINCKKHSENNYYFESYINGLDKNKEYQIYAELTDPSNIGTNKKGIVKLPDKTLGNEGKVNIVIKDNKLKYQYEGNLTNELKTLKLNKTEDGRYYISGEVLAIEWVNGKSTIPTDTPKVTFISTDGKKQLNTFVTSTGTNTYYFDIFIDNIDVTKQYKLKIELTTKYNISTTKANIINITKIPSYMGEFKLYKLIIKDNAITFKDDTYIGNINSELKTFKVAKNSSGITYVSGEIVVVEWVNGKSTVPKVAPKMKFKSTDGKVNMEVFVTATGTNTYYFDRFIEGIDTSKEYYFEIESGDSKNVSTNRSMNVYFTGTKYNNTIVGKYQKFNIRLLSQRILFESDTYVGNINSELKTFKVAKNSSGATYVSGQIVVVEWVNGKSTVPKVAPKMKFKSTDGKVNMEVFVTATGTNTYYFDRFIEGIDTSKEYYFEIESGDSKNVSTNRSMNVYFTGTKYNNTIVGKYQKFNIRLLKQKIIFEK